MKPISFSLLAAIAIPGLLLWLPAAQAQEKAPPSAADVDYSDPLVWARAKEMHKLWPAASGKNNALPWLSALGSKIAQETDVKNKQ